MSRNTVELAGACFNIRTTLQKYKDKRPPETEVYMVSREDLLEMLMLTDIIWNKLLNIEAETRSLITGIIDSHKVIQ